MNPVLLHEDNHCLAVAKPAGMPTQGDAHGAPALIDWVREDLRRRHRKPGQVFVGLVHRLDQPVSGAVLFARTSKGASRLSEQFRSGAIEKIYWAIVEGAPSESEGGWTDWLVKDRARNVSRVAGRGEPEAKEAQLNYRVLEHAGGRSWLELRPIHGRSHQLRVQLASRGLPIVGDVKYGASSRLDAEQGGHRIALHAWSISYRHPTRGEAIAVLAPVPADWPGLSP